MIPTPLKCHVEPLIVHHMIGVRLLVHLTACSNICNTRGEEQQEQTDVPVPVAPVTSGHISQHMSWRWGRHATLCRPVFLLV